MLMNFPFHLYFSWASLKAAVLLGQAFSKATWKCDIEWQVRKQQNKRAPLMFLYLLLPPVCCCWSHCTQCSNSLLFTDSKLEEDCGISLLPPMLLEEQGNPAMTPDGLSLPTWLLTKAPGGQGIWSPSAHPYLLPYPSLELLSECILHCSRQSCFKWTGGAEHSAFFSLPVHLKQD